MMVEGWELDIKCFIVFSAFSAVKIGSRRAARPPLFVSISADERE